MVKNEAKHEGFSVMEEFEKRGGVAQQAFNAKLGRDDANNCVRCGEAGRCVCTQQEIKDFIKKKENESGYVGDRRRKMCVDCGQMRSNNDDGLCIFCRKKKLDKESGKQNSIKMHIVRA